MGERLSGYIGKRNATEIIIEGLKKLEYRGYDSSGIAIYRNNALEVEKYKGRIAILEEAIKNKFDVNDAFTTEFIEKIHNT